MLYVGRSTRNLTCATLSLHLASGLQLFLGDAAAGGQPVQQPPDKKHSAWFDANHEPCKYINNTRNSIPWTCTFLGCQHVDSTQHRWGHQADIRPCAPWALQSFQNMLCTSQLKIESRYQQLDVDAKQQVKEKQTGFFLFLPRRAAVQARFKSGEARPETLHLLNGGGSKLATLDWTFSGMWPATTATLKKTRPRNRWQLTSLGFSAISGQW